MSFIAPFQVVFAIQFYWISIVLIGCATLLIFQKYTKSRLYLNAVLPLPAKLVLYTAIGFAAIGIVTVVGYLLKLGSWWLGVSYLVLLATSLFAVYINRTILLIGLRKYVRRLRQLPLFSAISFFSIVLLADFVLSLFIGGYLFGDGFVHISKIRHLIDHGFTLTDAYYGTVPETRHHVSVLHTLYAIPSYFGIDPLNSWFFSLAFFRLVKWCAIFYLAWFLLGLTQIESKHRTSLSASAGILGIVLFNSYLVNYPSFFIVVWVMLFIIGIISLLVYGEKLIYVAASFLIALTHPLISLGTCILLAMICAGVMIFNKHIPSKASIKTISISFIILVSTPIFSSLLPNQMTESAINYGMDKYEYFQLFGLSAFMPNLYQYTGILNSLIYAIFTLIGLVVIYRMALERTVKIVILCLLLFLPVTIYNPMFSSLVKEFLPIWAQARLTAVNGLIFVGALFSIYACTTLVSKRYKNIVSRPALTLCITLIILLISQSFNTTGVKGQEDYIHNLASVQFDRYKQLKAIGDLLSVVDDGSVVVAEKYYDNFMIPVMSSVHVTAISEGNSSPAADMVGRSRCYEQLINTLDKSLLDQVGAKYILAARESSLHHLAKSKAYLKLINGNFSHELFKVIDHPQDIVLKDKVDTTICVFNE